MPTPVECRGVFVLEYHHDDGTFWSEVIPNGVTVEGVNHVLDAAFRAAARYATWYVGAIDDSGFAAVANTDTHAAHPGWAEYTGVFGSNRSAWSPNPAAGGVMGSGTPTTIQITADGTVRGVFLASRQPVGLSGGAVLYCTGALAAGRAVAAGGTLTITYQLRLRPGA